MNIINGLRGAEGCAPLYSYKLIFKGRFNMNEDLSNLFEKFNINKDSISPDMINNLMGMLGNNSSQHANQEHNNYSEDTYSSSRYF